MRESMGPERSNPLHNFSFPYLKWGTQRLLRCVNNPSLDPNNSSKFIPPQNDTKPKNDDSIHVVQETIIGDLKLASNDLKVSIFNDDAIASASVAVASNGAIRPWNLRTRRAACKAPPPPPPPIPPREEGRRFFDVGSSSPSPVKEKKKMKIVGNERIKFSVSLSKEEVEQDFWALLGTRPPRRPRKRPRIVQRQLDTILPGMWLGEITAESYKVSDVPE